MFITLETNYFQLWFLYKSDLNISAAGKKNYLNLTLFKIKKLQYLPYYLSDEGFKDELGNSVFALMVIGHLKLR